MVTYPKDWTTYDFGSYFSFLPNNTFPRAVESSSGSVANIHYGDVLVRYRETIDNRTDIPRLIPSVEFKTEAFLQPNDAIFADTAEDETVGKCTQLISAKSRVVAGLHTIPCRPNVATAPGFLGYYLNSALFHDQLIPYITGIKVSSISKASILETTLTVPSFPEQHAIVEVLSGFDDHLANLDDLIAKKKAIRDGVLDELLTVKQRLFGFNGDWTSLALEEVAAIYDGVHQTPDYEASGIRFVSVEDVFDLYGSAKFISQTSYLRDFKVHPSKGDVLMTRIGDIGTPAYISDEEPLAYYVSLALLKPIQINGLFLYYYIQSKSFQRELFDRSLLHATPKKINKGEIGFCLVTMPRDLEEQRAIASVLSSIDEEIRFLVEERAKIELLKLGAMDDLLAGRVRLPIEEEAA